MSPAPTRKKPVRKKWGEPGSKVRRETETTVFSARKRRPVIVMVTPDGVCGFRLKGERRWYYKFADTIYKEAAAETKANERAKRKRGKR